MTQYYLGADLGGTKTHVMICDETGQALGFGEGGPGNHESVGYEGFKQSLHQAANAALKMAGLKPSQINGSGHGVAGYDWPIELEPTLNILSTLDLGGAIEVVNDTDLGLLAGSPRMWGIAVVSGTGCNCRGWDESKTRFGRVTGGGVDYGENAGAAELMVRTQQALGHAWTGRGPATALAEAFCKRYNSRDLGELLQDCICHTKELSAADAPLVFEVARQGDTVANDLIHWAGQELGEMVCTVIRQLQFETVDFDLVQIGGMWEGSPVLTEEMSARVQAIAPHAHVIRTHEPPVIGAVLLGMQAGGLKPSLEVRSRLIESLSSVKGKKS